MSCWKLNQDICSGKSRHRRAGSHWTQKVPETLPLSRDSNGNRTCNIEIVVKLNFIKFLNCKDKKT